MPCRILVVHFFHLCSALFWFKLYSGSKDLPFSRVCVTLSVKVWLELPEMLTSHSFRILGLRLKDTVATKWAQVPLVPLQCQIQAVVDLGASLSHAKFHEESHRCKMAAGATWIVVVGPRWDICRLFTSSTQVGCYIG